MQHWQWDRSLFPVGRGSPPPPFAGYGARPSRVTILIWHAVELRPVDSHVVLMAFILAILLNWTCVMRVSLAANPQRKASSDVPSPSNCQADCQQTSFRAWRASLFQRCYIGESALPIRCNTSFQTLGQCSLVRAACHSPIGVEVVLVARFGGRLYLIPLYARCWFRPSIWLCTQALNRDQW